MSKNHQHSESTGGSDGDRSDRSADWKVVIRQLKHIAIFLQAVFIILSKLDVF